jgi:hypothetical protein
MAPALALKRRFAPLVHSAGLSDCESYVHGMLECSTIHHVSDAWGRWDAALGRDRVDVADGRS